MVSIEVFRLRDDSRDFRKCLLNVRVCDSQNKQNVILCEPVGALGFHFILNIRDPLDIVLKCLFQRGLRYVVVLFGAVSSRLVIYGR